MDQRSTGKCVFALREGRPRIHRALVIVLGGCLRSPPFSSYDPAAVRVGAAGFSPRGRVKAYGVEQYRAAGN